MTRPINRMKLPRAINPLPDCFLSRLRRSKGEIVFVLGAGRVSFSNIGATEEGAELALAGEKRLAPEPKTMTRVKMTHRGERVSTRGAPEVDARDAGARLMIWPRGFQSAAPIVPRKVGGRELARREIATRIIERVGAVLLSIAMDKDIHRRPTIDISVSLCSKLSVSLSQTLQPTCRIAAPLRRNPVRRWRRVGCSAISAIWPRRTQCWVPSYRARSFSTRLPEAGSPGPRQPKRGRIPARRGG